MIQRIIGHLYNLLGWRTDRKLIVIASDDWGSIRVDSTGARALLIGAGVYMDGNRFNRFDCLENEEDLSQLFSVLKKHTDKKGNHPIITAMTIVANPDFEKISANNFEKYFYEPLSDTFKKTNPNVLALYKQGINEGIFIPQFHGREHLNINRWITSLQRRDAVTIKAFKSRFFMIEQNQLPKNIKGFGAAFDLDRTQEIEEHSKIVKDGLAIFERTFGYKSTFFTAPSLIFNNNIVPALKNSGITAIDLPKYRKMPIGESKTNLSINYIGKKLQGLQVLTRNAVFEPNLSKSDDGVATCLRDIAKAFSARKPAIISNHRAAFSGGIDKPNREKGLLALDRLIAEILTKWPDAEFVSVPSLLKIMNTK